MALVLVASSLIGSVATVTVNQGNLAPSRTNSESALLLADAGANDELNRITRRIALQLSENGGTSARRSPLDPLAGRLVVCRGTKQGLCAESAAFGNDASAADDSLAIGWTGNRNAIHGIAGTNASVTLYSNSSGAKRPSARSGNTFQVANGASSPATTIPDVTELGFSHCVNPGLQDNMASSPDSAAWVASLSGSNDLKGLVAVRFTGIVSRDGLAGSHSTVFSLRNSPKKTASM
jgi:hypothetical protein